MDDAKRTYRRVTTDLGDDVRSAERARKDPKGAPAATTDSPG